MDVIVIVIGRHRISLTVLPFALPAASCGYTVKSADDIPEMWHCSQNPSRRYRCVSGLRALTLSVPFVHTNPWLFILSVIKCKQGRNGCSRGTWTWTELLVHAKVTLLNLHLFTVSLARKHLLCRLQHHLIRFGSKVTNLTSAWSCQLSAECHCLSGAVLYRRRWMTQRRLWQPATRKRTGSSKCPLFLFPYKKVTACLNLTTTEGSG